MPATTFGTLLQGDLDMFVGVPGYWPRPARMALRCATLPGQTSGRNWRVRRRAIGFVKLSAELGDLQTQSLVGFFQILDPLSLPAILSFQPLILALQGLGL